MSSVERALPRQPAIAVPGVDLHAVGAWCLAFALTLYLALSGGGYDTIVHGEVGIAAWWILLLGAAAGVLPLARLGRRGWIAVGLLAAFVVLTALGLTWTESSERTALELARVATYLGLLLL